MSNSGEKVSLLLGGIASQLGASLNRPLPSSPGQTPASSSAMPSPWFIPTQPTTSEVMVAWHVGYTKYYQRLEQLITWTSEGDEILISAWLLNHTQTLEKRTLEYLLQAAVGRKVTVRAILSKNQSPNGILVNEDAARAINNLGGRAVLDGQIASTSTALGTFHQKSVYIRVQGVARIFVGGMDIAAGRIDAAGQNTWLDLQAEITGHGADLGKFTLEQRWCSNTGDILSPFVARKEQNQTFVQFVRTYGKPGSVTRAYATAGEFTVHALLENACKQAKETIYIEDQYFVGDRVNLTKPNSLNSLDEALKDAVARGVELVVVTTRSEQAEKSYAPWTRRKELIELLKNGLSTPDRVKVLQFKPAFNKDVWNNYVHTKTWIFDDQFAVVGSANYSRMSMTFEGEFSFGVSSTDADLIPSLRRALWLALLNAPGTAASFKAADVTDWATGVASLTGSSSPLEAYVVNPPPGTTIYSATDPDGS